MEWQTPEDDRREMTGNSGEEYLLFDHAVRHINDWSIRSGRVAWHTLRDLVSSGGDIPAPQLARSKGRVFRAGDDLFLKLA